MSGTNFHCSEFTETFQTSELNKPQKCNMLQKILPVKGFAELNAILEMFYQVSFANIFYHSCN
jgi:hypothetical protein